ncbi:DUF5687 family protein [Pseudotenacibaculum haliotis]|uniref:DUF5687 family protein n=1 Tax=Pseudotenacibaculum haliotis TaxID=1862138 RepID=A0ABW5LSP4_9FLAO
MIAHFLRLEWKQYFRAPYWQKSIGIKIFMGFFALYFIAMFLGMGFGLFPVLKKAYPDQDPFTIVNQALFYWISADLAVRFFLQKLPVMTVKPFLTLPVKRSKIVNFVLTKSIFSFFNFLPLFFAIPFSIVLIGKGYDPTQVWTWFGFIFLVTHVINMLNFFLENLMAKSELSILPIVGILGLLSGLNHYQVIPLSDLTASGITAILETPVYLLIVIGMLVVLYISNYRSLKNKLYVDSAVQVKIKEAKTSDLSWTRRFGDIAPFMQLDLRLIMRNKRTKSTLFILVIGLLYGLFFYPQPVYRDMEFFYSFIGIFSTGSFLINFGQFIPAWDSGYYKMLMSQNFEYKRYLESKFVLMSMSVVLLFVFGIPYVYFGWKILLVHFAAMIYNIGVNTHVIMYGGSFNRKKINLDQKAAFNYQGTGAVQWLIGIPLMVIPMGLFAALNYFINFEVAVTVLIALGLLGIVFHTKIMKTITKKYIKSKYKMIGAFDQDN